MPEGRESGESARRRARVRDGAARAPLSRRCDRGRRSRMQCNRSVFSMSCRPASAARRSHPCADWRSPTAATAEATALRSSSATAPPTLTESVEHSVITAFGVARASRSGSSLANSVTYLQAQRPLRIAHSPSRQHACAPRQPSCVRAESSRLYRRGGGRSGRRR